MVMTPERVGVGCDRPARELEDVGQHRLDAERAKQRRGGLEQQPETLDLVGVEAVVLWTSAFDVLSRQ